jgi:hypothetical protein
LFWWIECYREDWRDVLEREQRKNDTSEERNWEKDPWIEEEKEEEEDGGDD